MTELTFLGTGSSLGTPVIACQCKVCQSTDKADQRLRSSALLSVNGKNILIDAGPDFRQQLLRENITRLDAILITHEHKDHIAGLDDIRSLNHAALSPMNIYAEDRVLNAIRHDFEYAFAENKYPGAPAMSLHSITTSNFAVDDIVITPIRVMHMNLPILGYRVGDITYITDANAIDECEKQKIIGSKILVLNALNQNMHPSHFTLSQAIELAKELNIEQTYFTHISHLMGLHREVEQELPPNCFLAYDGLKINVN